jgi:hypothetical protein
MSNDKAQMSNECQMTNAKTDNHPSGIKKTKAFHGAGENTSRRLSTCGGPVISRQAKQRKHEKVGFLTSEDRSRFMVYRSPFTVYLS